MTTALRKTAADKGRIPARLYLFTLFLLIVVRVGLSLLGYRRLEQFIPPCAKTRDDRVTPWEVAWTVKRMAGFVPAASCLTQAVTLQYLLSRRGERSVMNVGVAPAEPGRFHAHAWLLWNDQIIIGGRKNLAEFQMIARLETRTQ